MDIIRNVVAFHVSKMSFAEVKTVHGVPLTLSVDLQDLESSWRFLPNPSPSMEMKLKMGLYGDIPDQYDLLKLKGEGLSYRDFRLALHVMVPGIPDRPEGFWAIDGKYVHKVRDWILSVFENGKCTAAREDLERLARGKKDTDWFQLESRMGAGSCHDVWHVYSREDFSGSSSSFTLYSYGTAPFVHYRYLAGLVDDLSDGSRGRGVSKEAADYLYGRKFR